MKPVQEMKVTRKQLQDERFKMLLGKICQTQTNHEAAYAINKLQKSIKEAQKEYADRFNALKDKYAIKKEDGTCALGKDEAGNEVPDSWMPKEEEREALFKEMGALDAEETTLKGRPLTPAVLKDVKISAFEIELLGELYTPENGPGVPHGLHAI